MTKPSELLFVYNADGGLFDQLTDAAHKAFSPSSYQCNLCKITYGLLTEKRAWRRFIEGLPIPCRFLHRDALQRRFPALEIPLPAVLRVEGGDAPEVCIDADSLNRCDDLDALMHLVRSACVELKEPGGDELA
ncbi:MAG: hypothetical protein GVY22_00675 [Gammaproteobacteria bacterium]|jgi:hypothetical protein|nr:hypothetical protein [Gammaproteobacteria bacterium]